MNLTRVLTVALPDIPARVLDDKPPRSPAMGFSAATMTRNGARAIKQAFHGMAVDKSNFTADVLERYAFDAQRPGAITGMINWYRAAFRIGGKLRAAWPKIETPTLIVWGEDRPTAVERMLRSSGSRIDPDGMRLYARLAGNSGHVGAALGLMAHWDLHPLARDLPHLRCRLILVTGSQDGMVPPAESYRVRALVPGAELVSFRGLGHLAHEERPDEIAALLQRSMAHEAAG